MNLRLKITLLFLTFYMVACTNASVKVSSLNSLLNFTIQMRTSTTSVVSGPLTVYVEFSEPVASFVAADVTLMNASISGSIQGSGQEYHFTIVPTGPVSVMIPAYQIKSLQTGKYNFDPVYLNMDFDNSTAVEVTFAKAVNSNLEGDTTSSRQLGVTMSSTKPYDVIVQYIISDALTTMPSTRHSLPPSGSITIPAGSTTGFVDYMIFGDTSVNANDQLVVSLESTNSSKAVLKENLYIDSVIDDDGGAIQKFISVSSSLDNTCRINQLNELYCWGNNSNGAVGVGNRNQVIAPTRIDSTVNYLQVSMSQEGNHACAITTSGVLKCWGQNTSGQLGTGDTLEHLIPTVIDSGTGYRFVSTGYNHTCAITNSDALKCWGANTRGQLGNGTTLSSSSPVIIGVSTYEMISAGFDFTCAITASNQLLCWGENNNYQLAVGDTAIRTTPTAVLSAELYSFVSTGRTHVCAIVDLTGQLRCWGSGGGGKLGDGTTTNRANPVMIDVGVSYTTVTAAQQHTCGITDQNILKCWGANISGELGDGTLVQRNFAVVVNAGTRYSSVKTAYSRTCAITEEDDLQCWGTNNLGALTYAAGTQLTPKLIADTKSYEQISTSQYSTWGLSNQRLYVWGAVNSTNLGPIYPVPKHFPTPEIPAKITATADHQCFISTTGKLFCRGNNTDGQLGIGVAGGYYQDFVAVQSPDRYIEVSTGPTHTCGITELQILKCWGQGTNGKLGNGTVLPSLYPQDIANGDFFIKVAAGREQTCGLTTSQTIYCWGANASGQLGNGSTAAFIVPALVMDPSTFLDVHAGLDRFCATTTDGSIKCWGEGLLGGNGDGLTTDNLVPGLISSAATFSRTSAGSYNSCGITTASELFCWGQTTGRNDVDQSSSTPVAIDVGTGYLQHTIATTHACGLTTAGRVKCWGYSPYRATGLGSPIRILLPMYLQ